MSTHCSEPASLAQGGRSLVVLARGLGLLAVAARAAHGCLASEGPQGAVLVLGAFDYQKDLLAHRLACLAPPPCAEWPLALRDVTGVVLAPERQRLYAEPVVLLVPPRILIVDLLRKVADPKVLRGVIVLNAHRASADSGESFWCVSATGRVWNRRPRTPSPMGATRDDPLETKCFLF